MLYAYLCRSTFPTMTAYVSDWMYEVVVENMPLILKIPI